MLPRGGNTDLEPPTHLDLPVKKKIGWAEVGVQ